MFSLNTNVPNLSKQPLKVLLVEDSPSDADLIQESLNDLAGNPIQIDWATRLSEAFERLRENTYDAIMLDLTLPDSQPSDTIAHTRGLYPDIPIVVLTGLQNRDVALQSLRDGAQDYILKDRVEGDSLLRSVQYAIERHRAEELAEMALKRECEISVIVHISSNFFCLKSRIRQVDKQPPGIRLYPHGNLCSRHISQPLGESLSAVRLLY